MQHDVIVGSIPGVRMRRPVPRMQMQFDVTGQIVIAQTQARYLKVVTKPLAAAVTTDTRYRDILVTEMQVFQVVPAEEARGRTSRPRRTWRARWSASGG